MSQANDPKPPGSASREPSGRGEPITEREIRLYVDGELPPEEAAALERRLEADEGLRARVLGESRLRERVSEVMRAVTPEVPEDLTERVRQRLGERAAGARVEKPEAPARRSWLEGPTRANFFAVAASLALIAGAVLFGIFGPPIDTLRPAPAADLVTEAARFASDEHIRCAGELARDHQMQEIVWTSREDAVLKLREHLGAPAAVPDLSALGYEFVGAGACRLPGVPTSAHLLYARDVPAEDGCRQTLLSLFVAPDDGKLDPRQGAARPPGEWRRVGARPACRKLVVCCTDGVLVHFMVCCNESEIDALAEFLR